MIVVLQMWAATTLFYGKICLKEIRDIQYVVCNQVKGWGGHERKEGTQSFGRGIRGGRQLTEWGAEVKNLGHKEWEGEANLPSTDTQMHTHTYTHTQMHHTIWWENLNTETNDIIHSIF